MEKPQTIKVLKNTIRSRIVNNKKEYVIIFLNIRYRDFFSECIFYQSFATRTPELAEITELFEFRL